MEQKNNERKDRSQDHNYCGGKERIVCQVLLRE